MVAWFCCLNFSKSFYKYKKKREKTSGPEHVTVFQKFKNVFFNGFFGKKAQKHKQTPLQQDSSTPQINTFPHNHFKSYK